MRRFTRRTCLSLALLGFAGSALFGIAPRADAEELSYVLTASRWGSAQDSAVRAAGGTVTYSHGRSGIAVVTSGNPTFLANVLASNAISGGARDQFVQWQHPVAEVTLEENAVTPGDETFINLQWNIRSIEAPAAWAAGFTGQGVRVAVLDGGIHSAHQDLDANIDVAASKSFVPGFSFNQDTGTFWHGTHVAGIIAAEDNALGTIGVAPNATIVGVKVLHNGSGAFGWVIAGILYAATAQAEGGGGADIINMSLGATFPKGGGPGTGQLISALNKAVNFAGSNGVLVISAAGNDDLDLDHSASYTTVPAMSGNGLAVSATGPMGYAVGYPNGATDFREPSSYTNFGNSLVTVAAPGGDFRLPGNAVCSIPRTVGTPVVNFCWVFDMVISTSRGGPTSTTSYSFAAGTSMAAPAAAGVAALIKQRFPGISVGALKNQLARTADDEGKNGHDPFYGRGFVNARRAVTE
ncbi:MAG TPA: S8 family serine peptidase [Casimicrobiaceae bacterium]|nr:S8 family serine peptidase [Casimicrobiaceae bacterium]